MGLKALLQWSTLSEKKPRGHVHGHQGQFPGLG